MNILGPSEVLELNVERKKKLEACVLKINDSLSSQSFGEDDCKTVVVEDIEEYEPWMFTNIKRLYEEKGWSEVEKGRYQIDFYA